MTDAVALPTETADPTVLRALRRLRGRATVGDVSAATGMANAEAEAELRRLLEGRRGHLEVGERGDLVYSFDPGLLERGAESLWVRFKRSAWSFFQKAFKVWIVAMLVIYFVIFVALLIAALFAGDRDGKGGGLGGGRRRGGHLPLGDMLFWYWIWSPGWRRRPYYGEGYGRQRVRDKKDRSGPPFYKKVFAFVFGPDQPEVSPTQRDRDLLRFIRSRSGVVTAAELVQHTGLGLHDAEEELARLMAAHDGDVKVSDDGTLLYLFSSLMVSAHGEVRERDPAPAWRRLEPRQPLTGNKAGTNTLVAGINGFNMLAAATAPWFIFPRLGIGGTAAEVGLIWIPVVFSTLFFAVPAARWLGVTRENSRRAVRNVRKVLLGMVSKVSLAFSGPEAVHGPEATEGVRAALPDKTHAKVPVEAQLDRLVAEFDGEVEPSADGTLAFRFPGFRRSVEASHQARREFALGEQRVGDIVYSSADDEGEQDRRDLEAFDRELAAGPTGAAASIEARSKDSPSEPLALPPGDLSPYLNDPLRVAFRDERELAALQQELRQEAAGRARSGR